MAGDDRSFKFTRSRREAAMTETEAEATTTLTVSVRFINATNFRPNILSRSGLGMLSILLLRDYLVGANW
jgi:hypothetical protein